MADQEFTYIVTGVVLRQILPNSVKFQAFLLLGMSLLLHNHFVLVFYNCYLRLISEQLIDL